MEYVYQGIAGNMVVGGTVRFVYLRTYTIHFMRIHVLTPMYISSEEG